MVEDINDFFKMEIQELESEREKIYKQLHKSKAKLNALSEYIEECDRILNDNGQMFLTSHKNNDTLKMEMEKYREQLKEISALIVELEDKQSRVCEKIDKCRYYINKFRETSGVIDEECTSDFLISASEHSDNLKGILSCTEIGTPTEKNTIYDKHINKRDNFPNRDKKEKEKLQIDKNVIAEIIEKLSGTVHKNAFIFSILVNDSGRAKIELENINRVLIDIIEKLS